MPHKPEVLAPAGHRDALHAALGAGANAIYIGLQEGFNARARANNFSLAELPEIVELVHKANAKLYVTLNTLVFEQELTTAADIIAKLDAVGVDAVIVQDPAMALLAQKMGARLQTHGSTQMTLSSGHAANFVKPLGLTRVVVPRELSVEEIRTYAATTDLELEVFIHGALCVSWSGQCLTSETWGGRSANRGQCAQSCRLPYKLIVDGELRDLGDVAYLLSPKDLAGIDVTADLADIGVSSLKIEGRQKDAQYVGSAVAAYRDAIDHLEDGWDAASREAHLTNMALSFSRGFSTGFFRGSDHQALVTGIAPRHRGVYLGSVLEVRGQQVTVVENTVGHESTGGRGIADKIGNDAVASTNYDELALKMTPVAGMGVVLERGEEQNDEQGGPVFAVAAGPLHRGAKTWILSFGRPGPDLARVQRNARVWITSSPQTDKAAKQWPQKGTLPLGRHGVTLHLQGTEGAPLTAQARLQNGISATATSSITLQNATGQSLSASSAADKLGAFGGTEFHLEHIDDSALATGLYVSPSELKVMRRNLVASLQEQMQAQGAARAPQTFDWINSPWASATKANHNATVVAADYQLALTVLCRNSEQLEAAIESGVREVELDWMELVGLAKAVQRAREVGLRVGIATVRVQKPSEEKIDAHLAKLAPDWILVRNWGSFGTLKDLAPGIELRGDFSLNVTNRITAQWVLAQGLSLYTPSHDLDVDQLQALLRSGSAAQAIVTLHHHIATFHTEHCVYSHLLSTGKDYRSCGRPCEKHEVSLRDRTQLEHPVIVDVGCRNTVFNAKAISAPSLVPALRELGTRGIRIELVRESRSEAAKVISAYQRLCRGELSAAEVAAQIASNERFGVSQGHVKLPMFPSTGDI